MIVAMDYTEAGWRYISNIAYASDWTQETRMARAEEFGKRHDEVYVIDIDNNCIPFIDEIVLHGCRIK